MQVIEQGGQDSRASAFSLYISCLFFRGVRTIDTPDLSLDSERSISYTHAFDHSLNALVRDVGVRTLQMMTHGLQV